MHHSKIKNRKQKTKNISYHIEGKHTALFFKEENKMKITFRSQEHYDFYKDMLKQSPTVDSYHQGLFYTLGISTDCRNHIDDLYDKKTDRIKIEGLDKGWQTSGSREITLFAFNLWNNFTLEDSKETTPYNLFASGNAPYFMEALKVKYPDYCHDISKERSER